MKRFTPAVLACFVAFCTAQRADAEEKIITLIAGRDAGDTIKAVEAMGGRYLRDLKLINAIVVDLPSAAKSSGLYMSPDIARVEDDLYIQWEVEPSDDFPFTPPSEAKGGPEAREIPWGVGAVKAPDLWDVTEGDGVKIAVLDSGIDSKHPDLADNYSGGHNTFNSLKPPEDDNGHGTWVAGVIAAARNLKGVVGVAPKAKLYAVKVLDRNKSGNLSLVIDGLQWAVENKMDIVNMSFSAHTGAPAFEEAVDAVVKSGITLICAAGNNSGPVNYPAKYEGTIAVTASDIGGRILDISATGPEVDFIAPGVGIRTTSKGSYYSRNISGTSVAAPHVTGVAALAIGLGIRGPDEIRKALTLSARDLHLAPSQQGAGQVDAGKLLKLFGPISQTNR